MPEVKDALVIGAGPAGSSCALWLERLGFSCLLAEASGQAGGLLNDSPYRNDWIVTQPGVTGIDLAEGIGLSLAAAGVPMLLGARARSAERLDRRFRVSFDMPNGKVRDIEAAKLVIATGVQPRSGPFRASERVLIGPGHRVATHDFSGKSVAILGGGDNAFENHGFVKRAGAREVHIYARTVRASRVFTAQVPDEDISTGPFDADHENVCVNGRPYDVILVMFGWEPASLFETGFTLTRNPAGFFLTDFQTCETSEQGVFAIGEVAAGRHPCVVTAMSDGIAAAKAIQRQLEAVSRPR